MPPVQYHPTAAGVTGRRSCVSVAAVASPNFAFRKFALPVQDHFDSPVVPDSSPTQSIAGRRCHAVPGQCAFFPRPELSSSSAKDRAGFPPVGSLPRFALRAPWFAPPPRTEACAPTFAASLASPYAPQLLSAGFSLTPARWLRTRE